MNSDIKQIIASGIAMLLVILSGIICEYGHEGIGFAVLFATLIAWFIYLVYYLIKDSRN